MWKTAGLSFYSNVDFVNLSCHKRLASNTLRVYKTQFIAVITFKTTLVSVFALITLALQGRNGQTTTEPIKSNQTNDAVWSGCG